MASCLRGAFPPVSFRATFLHRRPGRAGTLGPHFGGAGQAAGLGAGLAARAATRRRHSAGARGAHSSQLAVNSPHTVPHGGRTTLNAPPHSPQSTRTVLDPMSGTHLYDCPAMLVAPGCQSRGCAAAKLLLPAASIAGQSYR